VSSSPEHQRDLRAIRSDGVVFSATVGLGESYVPAFALAIGLGAVASGLVATVPMLAGAVFQLVTPAAVRRLASYRRWVVLCARLQALSFLPLVVGAACGKVDWPWVVLASVAYWSFGMATGPAWNAWVTSLVPAKERASFFAGRTRLAQTSLLFSLVAGGLLLERGRASGDELPVFAFLFAGALVARLASAAFLNRQSETPALARAHRALSPREVFLEIRAAGSLRVLAYLLAMQAASQVAAPFFTPYMLGPLSLSYAEFMVLTAAAFVARIAVLPALGRLAKRGGARTVLWIGALGIVPLPALWLVSSDFAYLLVVQLLAGCAWAAVEFATMLSFFEQIHEHVRASVLSAFNLANALMITLGSLAGAQLLRWLEGSETAFALIFVLSSLARLATVLVLRGVEPAKTVPPGFSLRTLAVRPSVGAVQRPILAGLSGEVPEAPGAPGRES